ncbi:MAG: hypothetical protein GEU93_11970 [Propionibacteriales bacterium]|nr:hypothetical protein [Propionibacteriales bacterium]
MLDLDTLDLREIADALDDHSWEHRWYLDPSTGDVHCRSEFDDTDDGPDPDELGWIRIHPSDSGEGYRDLQDFIARVGDPRAQDLLERAIAGRGAFRRFKDTLFEFPELREAWFALRDARASRRAVQWLLDERLVDEDQAQRAMQRFADPELRELSGGFDLEAVLQDTVTELRRLYGDRLRDVLLYGSYARGAADEESDVDVMAVLTEMDSAFAEIRRMGEALWGIFERHRALVSVMPFTEEEYERADTAFLQRVHAEGRKVA